MEVVMANGGTWPDVPFGKRSAVLVRKRTVERPEHTYVTNESRRCTRSEQKSIDSREEEEKRQAVLNGGIAGVDCVDTGRRGSQA
jgi:hypothetical protein